MASSDVWGADFEKFWHWNGSAWTSVPLQPPPTGRQMFVTNAIWGASSADVWAGGAFPADVDFLNREITQFLELVTQNGARLN